MLRCPRPLLTVAILACGVACVALTGCVRRTISISSEPAGALCWLNGREVGRTPITVDFLYYGDYDVQLTHEGFEPLLTMGKAESPLWDTIPFDLATEVWPAEAHSDIRWHYVMQPREDNRDALIDRASQLREKLLSEAPVPPASAQTQPQATTAPATQPQ